MALDLYRTVMDGQNMLARGHQQGLERRYNRLAGEAFNAPDAASRNAAIGQIAVNNPAAATALKGQYQQQDDARAQKAANIAKGMLDAVKSGDPAMVQGYWKAVRPFMQEINPGMEIPETWTPQMEAELHQAVAAAGYGNAGGAQFTLSPGSKRFGPNGEVVAEVPFAPASAQLVGVPDGRGGEIQLLFDPRTRQLSMPQYPGQQQSGPIGGVNIAYDGPPEDRAAFNAVVAADQAQPFAAGNFTASNLPAQRQWTQNTPNPYGDATPKMGYTPPKSETASQPSDIERRLALAQGMGASPDELRRMVVGGDSGRDAQRISSKDATTARNKVTQIQAARQQLESARQAFEKIRDSYSAGLGGNYLPTPEGQAFDRAIRNLAPLITAVTRVPGIGAMSDYESRLQEASLPSRGTYEAVTDQQFRDLENLLNTVEGGYTNLLGGDQQPDVPRGNAIPVNNDPFGIL